MVRNVRQYSKEYKEEAVKLAFSYGNVNQAAKELGVPGPTLHEWVTKAKSTGKFIESDDSMKPTAVGRLLEENKELKKRLLRLEQEKEIFKKGCDVLRQGAQVKYVFIKEHSNQFSIRLMCHLFKVSRSGFYSYSTRPLSNRQRANNELDKKIVTIFNHHKKRYGAPRITRVLQAQKELCSHTRVAKRMKHMGLIAVAKKKFKVTTDSEHHLPV